MIKSSRLCRIMIKDIKTKISELNIDFDYEAYWEIIYLILLAFFVGMRFLLSTMFTIYWPKYFYRTLTVIGVVLVLMHLMLSKDIKKKEILAMLVVTFVFMMSHYVSRYDFLVDLLILLLGAYRVNFRNILKTYIAVWSVLLVVTIIGAMLGFAKNLIYFQGDNGEHMRMTLGICYPTDLAAYVAFLMITYVCVRNYCITYLEIFIMGILSAATFYITYAKTNFILMMLIIVSCIILKIIKASSILEKKMSKIFMVGLQTFSCIFIWCLSGLFDCKNNVWLIIDKILSGRLALGKEALCLYPPKAFGQWIYEHGFGGDMSNPDYYFFIDSSYLSIGIKYGIVFLILIIVMNSIYVIKCFKEKNIYWITMLSIIALQGFTEHHLIQYWYNPFLIFLLSGNCKMKKEKPKKDDILDLN